MSARRWFATLVAIQAAHSLEEAIFGLYDWLPFFCWIKMSGVAFGTFVVLNLLFITFGVWCYFARVKPDEPGSGTYITIWAGIEIANGIGHPTWSIIAGSYVPGTATAPFLLMVALMLLWRRNNETKEKVTDF